MGNHEIKTPKIPKTPAKRGVLNTQAAEPQVETLAAGLVEEAPVESSDKAPAKEALATEPLRVEAWAAEPQVETLAAGLVEEALVDAPDAEAKALVELSALRVELSALREREKALLALLGLHSPTSPAASTKNSGVGDRVRSLFAQGLTNKEIVLLIAKEYGNDRTTYACVAWYRNKLKG